MSRSRWLLLLLVFALAAALSVTDAGADSGVGVTLESVKVEQKLSPGGAFDLPALGVVNTGSEAADYEVVVSYPGDRPERRPPGSWFSFQPQRFHLEAGANQSVAVRLELPAGAQQGDYFAYLEAHTVSDPSQSQVGAAAAAKLSFTVKPSGWLTAQRTRFNRFLDENQPWTWLLPALALLSLLGWLGHERLPYRLRMPFERK